MSEPDVMPRLIRRLYTCLPVGVTMAGMVYFSSSKGMHNAIGYREQHLSAFRASVGHASSVSR